MEGNVAKTYVGIAASVTLHVLVVCSQMNTEGWDVFMTVSRDSGIVAAQCFEGPVRIVKCVMYLLFFAIVLSCAFASKVSLLMMTTGAGDMKKVRFCSLP